MRTLIYILMISLSMIVGDHLGSNKSENSAVPVDVSTITAHPDKYHNRKVFVQGIVTSVCKEEGCFIDIVPISGSGDGVLINHRHGVKFPKENVVGKIALVRGTFYSKVYPFYRMDHWHHHGWRAWEKNIPAFARIFRIEADSVDFKESENEVMIKETPLIPFTSQIINMDEMEFEAAHMGTGKKCLNPGGITPEHSTKRYQEMIFGIEGEVFVKMENVSGELKLSPGMACYIPPNTKHSIVNKGSRKGCYIFVYSLPDQIEENHHKSK